MIGVDHGQPLENGLLDMDIAISAVREVSLDVRSRVVDGSTLERIFAQTTRRWFRSDASGSTASSLRCANPD